MPELDALSYVFIQPVGMITLLHLIAGLILRLKFPSPSVSFVVVEFLGSCWCFFFYVMLIGFGVCVIDYIIAGPLVIDWINNIHPNYVYVQSALITTAIASVMSAYYLRDIANDRWKKL